MAAVDFPPRERSLIGRIERFAGQPCVLSVWRVEIHGTNGYFGQAIVPLAIDGTGKRLPIGESLLTAPNEIQPTLKPVLETPNRNRLVISTLPEMLRREVEHRGLLRDQGSLAMQHIAWID